MHVSQMAGHADAQTSACAKSKTPCGALLSLFQLMLQAVAVPPQKAKAVICPQYAQQGSDSFFHAHVHPLSLSLSL